MTALYDGIKFKVNNYTIATLTYLAKEGEVEQYNNSKQVAHSLTGIFGDGHDFVIKDHADQSKKSFTQTGHTYIHPKYSKLTNKSKTFLAGTFKFKLSEIEIFQNHEWKIVEKFFLKIQKKLNFKINE